ncbi:hypothetical protein N9N03_00485 [Chlamydiia bacterium]|nr:hypothetical protein [Chlamydiia bacterium]
MICNLFANTHVVLVCAFLHVLYAVDPVVDVWREYLNVDFKIDPKCVVENFEVVDSETGRDITDIYLFNHSNVIYLDFYVSTESNSSFLARVDLELSHVGRDDLPFFVLDPNGKGESQSVTFTIDSGTMTVDKQNVKKAMGGILSRIPLIMNPHDLPITQDEVNAKGVSIKFMLSVELMEDE